MQSIMLAVIIWDQSTIAVAGPFAVAITAIVSYYLYKWNRVRSDNELKQSMIARGMSVEEMERVFMIDARRGKH
jgi:hypothetical protein